MAERSRDSSRVKLGPHLKGPHLKTRLEISLRDPFRAADLFEAAGQFPLARIKPDCGQPPQNADEMVPAWPHCTCKPVGPQLNLPVFLSLQGGPSAETSLVFTVFYSVLCLLSSFLCFTPCVLLRDLAIHLHLSVGLSSGFCSHCFISVLVVWALLW